MTNSPLKKRYGIRTPQALKSPTSTSASTKKEQSYGIQVENDVVVIPFQSKQTQTAFAPQWSYFIAELMMPDIDLDSLKDFLLSKEDEVKSIQGLPVNDCGTGLGDDSTTARFLYYNVFDWDHPEINKLKTGVKEFHRMYYTNILSTDSVPTIRARCWMNIMRKGDRVTKHLHGYEDSAYLSGHFTVSCNNTKTIYLNPYEHATEEEILLRVSNGEPPSSGNLYGAENVPGKLTLFPNYVPHMTTGHQSDEPRITLAFEITPFEDLPGRYKDGKSVKMEGETDLPVL